MQGRVIFFDETTSTGRLSGSDGVRYDFRQTDLKQQVQPAVGMDVDFEPRDGIARDIYLLGTGTAAGNGRYVGEVEPDLGIGGYMMRAITERYAAFGGRARRKEFWSLQLLNLIVQIGGLVLLIGAVSSDSRDASILLLIIFALAMLILFLPSLALMVRRLHDMGQPGWMVLLLILINVIPYVGSLVAFIGVIVIGVVEGQPFENRYGIPVKRS